MKEEVKSIFNQAWQHRNDGNYKSSRELLNQVLALDSSDPNVVAQVYAYQGQIERDLESPKKALLLYSKALKEYQSSGNKNGIAYAERHIADIAMELNIHEQAEESFKRALTIYREDESGNAMNIANTVRGYALLQEKTHQYHKSRSLWEEAREIYNRFNIQEGVGECDHHLSNLDKLMD